MPTIRDVAEHAGVSIATVSHVLNETRYVSPELITRVYEAVEALEYRPNAVARSLRRKQTYTLGVIIPDSSNPFFAEVIRGLEDICFDQGYNVILCNSDQSYEKERTYIELLIEKQIDGIVFISAARHSDHLQAAMSQNVPVIVVDWELQAVRCDSVLIDNRAGGWQATHHLVLRGHQRIGCIAGPSKVLPSWNRVDGYRDALEAANLSFDEELIRQGNFRAPNGYTAMQDLLTLPDPPTAVFVCNDLMAIGAMHAVAEQGLKVPNDIAVVGFDDIALAPYTNPPLTTVAQPRDKMGRLAAELLIARIAKSDRPVQRYLLETTLVVRQSS